MYLSSGKVVAQASQFGLNSVEVITATVDLEEVRAARYAPSRGLQAVNAPEYRRIDAQFRLSAKSQDLDFNISPSPFLTISYHVPEEEIAMGPACFLWDYLRRSRQAGFLLPLSGGIDSCATAVLVFSMCRIVVGEISKGNESVISDVQRIAGPYVKQGWLPRTPQELCHKASRFERRLPKRAALTPKYTQILHTVFMPMKNQSSEATRYRAQELSKSIGSYHTEHPIDDVFNAQTAAFATATGFKARFKLHGGSVAENIALQNIQARLRMVTAYDYSQLMPTVRGRPGGGSLLVLGSGNVRILDFLIMVFVLVLALEDMLRESVARKTCLTTQNLPKT